jgi:hypothetical protein
MQVDWNEINQKVDEMRKKDMTTEISVKWCAEDVLGLNPDLTLEQVEKVLYAVKHYHNAEIGINWDVLKTTIGIILDEEEE